MYWHLIKGTGFNSFVSPFDYGILGLIMIDAFASCTLIIYFFGKLNASRLINTRSFFMYVSVVYDLELTLAEFSTIKVDSTTVRLC